MIPDWVAAFTQASALLAPGGSLHLVEFGDMSGMPAPLRMMLKGWLTQFHVSPRLDLPDRAARLATRHKLTLRTRRGLGGYYPLITLRTRSTSQ